MWKDLIVNICVICDIAEDGHLISHGESFFAAHKMFEEIADSLHDFPDAIQEIYFGARDLNPVPSIEIRKAEVQKLQPVKTTKDAARIIRDVLIEILEQTKTLDEAEDVTLGEQDLLSKIAGEAQQKLYFVQNFLK